MALGAAGMAWGKAWGMSWGQRGCPWHGMAWGKAWSMSWGQRGCPWHGIGHAAWLTVWHGIPAVLQAAVSCPPTCVRMLPVLPLCWPQFTDDTELALCQAYGLTGHAPSAGFPAEASPLCYLLLLAMLQGDKDMSWRAVVCLVPAMLRHAAARDARMQAAPSCRMRWACMPPCHAMFGLHAAAILCHARLPVALTGRDNMHR